MSIREKIEKKNLPHGIHIMEPDNPSGSEASEALEPTSSEPGKARLGINGKENPAENPTSWSYLFLQHMAARNFLKWLKRYNKERGHQPFFIHQTYQYCYKNEAEKKGVKKILEPSVSGLVFLQGTVKGIQKFLKQYFPQYHLVNDCSTGKPASIRDTIMQPFMNVMHTHPEQITFLRDPFEKFSRDHVKLRVLTGPFAGYEGYIVRIDRDRQLVFDFGGYAVALRGVHNEDFEEVKQSDFENSIVFKSNCFFLLKNTFVKRYILYSQKKTLILQPGKLYSGCKLTQNRGIRLRGGAPFG